VKKICNLATVHPRDDVRIFRKECCAEASCYEVHYVTCDGRGDELTKEGIRIHGIKKYESKLLRAIFAPFEIYKQARVIDAHIYALHDPELLLIALLLLKKKATNVLSGTAISIMHKMLVVLQGIFFIRYW